MSAREAILAALGPDSLPDAARRRMAADALLTAMERPPEPIEELDRLFVAKLTLPSVGATVAAIDDLAALPGAIADYLQEQGQPARLYLPPDPRIEALDWRGLERLASIPVDGGTALAFSVAGVAETGSLVLETSPTSPMLPNFLALHHIVAVARATLVPWLEDVPLPAPPGPRTRYWITGVSGTTDIEGQYVRGAHGPRFLHVILYG